MLNVRFLKHNVYLNVDVSGDVTVLWKAHVFVELMTLNARLTVLNVREFVAALEIAFVMKVKQSATARSLVSALNHRWCAHSDQVNVWQIADVRKDAGIPAMATSADVILM